MFLLQTEAFVVLRQNQPIHVRLTTDLSWSSIDSHRRLMNAMYGHRLAGIFGYSHLTGGFAGGQAEYVRVPKGAVNLLPVPDGLPDEKVLYLSDVVGTSYHNAVDTGVKEGDVVAVWVRLA